MKNCAPIAAAMLALLLMAGCGTSQPPAPSSPTPDPTHAVATVDYSVCKEIQRSIEASITQDATVLVSGKDEGVQISITIDPVVMNYQFAMVLDPAASAAKEALVAQGVALVKFQVAGIYYKDGETDGMITWESTDMETGFLAATKDAVFKDMSLADVLEFCEYPE